MEGRDQFRWEPNTPVSRDLRVFALLAATSSDTLPEATLTWLEDCSTDHCARLSLDDGTEVDLMFTDEGNRYALTSFSEG